MSEYEKDHHSVSLLRLGLRHNCVMLYLVVLFHSYVDRKIKVSYLLILTVLSKTVLNPPKQALDFTCLQYKAFEYTVRKGEIARNEFFLPNWRTFICKLVQF